MLHTNFCKEKIMTIAISTYKELDACMLEWFFQQWVQETSNIWTLFLWSFFIEVLGMEVVLNNCIESTMWAYKGIIQATHTCIHSELQCNNLSKTGQTE